MTEGGLVNDLLKARKSYEEERDYMNDRIESLQKELTDSVNALRQQRESIVKIERMHSSDLNLWHEKLSKANQTELDLRIEHIDICFVVIIVVPSIGIKFNEMAIFLEGSLGKFQEGLGNGIVINLSPHITLGGR